MAAFERPVATASRLAHTEHDFRRLLRRVTIELVIALALPLLILLGAFAFMVYSTHWVQHSDQVRAQMNRAEALLETMVSDIRMYRLTMQRDYLDDFRAVQDELDPTLYDLETMVSDNPSQEALAIQFHSQADKWINYANESLNRLAVKNAGGNSSAEIETSQDLSAAALGTAKKLIDNENHQLRAERNSMFRKSAALTAIVFFLLVCTVIPVGLHHHRLALKQIGGMYTRSLLHLAQEEWRSSNALAVGGAGSWTWDPHNDLMTGDVMLSKTFGIQPEDCEKGFAARRLLSAVNKQDRVVLEAQIREAFRRHIIFNSEFRVIDVSSHERWLHVRGRVERDGRGKAVKMFGFLIDVTDRKRADIALMQSTERFRLFAAVADVAIWTANSSGEFDYANEQCISFFGDPNVVGHPWYQYVHPNDRSRMYGNWENSVNTGETYEDEVRMRFRTGEYRWILVRARCMRDEQGKITRWFGASVDIDALKKAQQSAQDANRAKDVFLASLSHELRNPLNPALLVASEEAENPELPEPCRSSFEVILKNIELEVRLIDDLLDLTRITAGKLSLRRQLVDVHNIFMDALASVQSDQLSKKIELTVDWGAQKNQVNGDPLRLRQIFWNILKNAVKFTPPDGSVRVRASNADSHVVIKVTDTGIGINSDELSRLFNPFAQGDHAGETGSQAYGGLGLGLAITKNLADMHAGKISAESEGTNKGSTFTVELPLAA